MDKMSDRICRIIRPNFECQFGAGVIARHFRLGSDSDVRDGCLLRPLLRVKQTYSSERRMFGARVAAACGPGRYA